MGESIAKGWDRGGGSLRARLRELAEPEPGLDLLLLFGSRATGGARDRSDWDLGYIGGPAFDVEGFLGRAVEVLGTDLVDLVDLQRAGGVLRYRAARDGDVLFERDAGRFASFWHGAVGFWLDAEPVVRAAHDALLEELG